MQRPGEAVTAEWQAASSVGGGREQRRMQEFSQVTGTQSSTWDLWKGLRDTQKLTARWEFTFQPSRSYQGQPFRRSLAQVEKY